MNVQKEVLVRLQASQVLLTLPLLLFACWYAVGTIWE